MFSSALQKCKNAEQQHRTELQHRVREDGIAHWGETEAETYPKTAFSWLPFALA